LVLDYSDWPRTVPLAVWLPKAGLLLVLFAATVWAVRRRLWWGFWGAWFFLLLAPSSSFLPLPTEPAAERRMYLPLLAVIAVTLGGGRQFCRVLWNRFGWSDRARVRLETGVVIALTVALGIATFQRNAQYRTALSIWADVVAKRPGSVRGQVNLGLALLDDGKAAESIPHFMDALRLAPNQPVVRCDLGSALVANGAVKEGIARYEEALRLDPNFTPARAVLADVLANQTNSQAALEYYQESLSINPDNEEEQFHLAQLLARMGRLEEAVTHYTQALRLNPNLPEVRSALAEALERLGRHQEAQAQLAEARRLQETAASP
jgi:tetratricopeptide (TPR) repeat protein